MDFDFLALMRFDMTFDVTLRDDSHISLLLLMFGIKANSSEKEYWKSIYLRFAGPLKPSSSICYVLFSSEEKYCGPGSVVVSQNPFKTYLGTPTSVIQFISNYAYYQYFLQALTPALTFTLKLLVI